MANTYYDLGYTSNGLKWGIADVTGGALTSGVQGEIIDEMARVLYVMGVTSDPFQTADYVYDFDVSVNATTLNQVDINMQTMQASHVGPTWADAAAGTGLVYKLMVWGY